MTVVFSSMLFVFVFLTANLASQLLLKTIKAKNIAMLLFSLVFYAWAGLRYLPLLMGMVLVCWLGAMRVEACPDRGAARRAMAATVGVCLLSLGAFKYAGFFARSLRGIAGIPGIPGSVALPLGISFYTFQLISYVADVYRGETKAQRKYWLLLLYAGLFHQCVAGPIVRYRDVERELRQRRVCLAEASRGVSRFTVGLAKKAVLANGCAAIADELLVTDKAALAATPAMGILLGLFAFTLEIYLDFSAYSDMAIGMGLLCGFHYRENFDYPYMSVSLREFWRRWHISLGTFFRDYVYIPLGGGRCARFRQTVNLLLVWLLTGLWHGAGWNYVLWGCYFGLLLVAERGMPDMEKKLPRPVRHGLVLALVMFSWLIFKYTDMGLLAVAVRGLFRQNGNGFSSGAVELLFKNNLFFLLAASAACTPLGGVLRKWLERKSEEKEPAFILNGVWEITHPVLLLLAAAMALVGDSYNPFLYFQF